MMPAACCLLPDAYCLSGKEMQERKKLHTYIFMGIRSFVAAARASHGKPGCGKPSERSASTPSSPRTSRSRNRVARRLHAPVSLSPSPFVHHPWSRPVTLLDPIPPLPSCASFTCGRSVKDRQGRRCCSRACHGGRGVDRAGGWLQLVR